MYRCAHRLSNIATIVATLLASRLRDRSFVCSQDRILHTSPKRRNRLSFSDAYQGSLFLRVNRPGRDADHCLPSNAEGNNV